MSTQPFILA